MLRKNTLITMGRAALPIAVLSIILASCNPYYEERDRGLNPPETVEGYAPIYDSTNSSKVIRTTAPRAVLNGGKIYIKDNRLYQVETGRGIHIMDITDATQPSKLAFIEIMGCQEMSIKGDLLYSNNLNDLVVVNISNLASVTVADRISNAFDVFNPDYPPASTSGWYECVDSRKGKVVGWEMKTLNRPQCR